MLINRIPMEILPAGATSEQPAGEKGFSTVVTAIIYRADSMPVINIPEGTKKLRSYLFYDCWPSPALTVVVPRGVTQIDSKAFCNCDIASVEFPSTITALPSDCFKDTAPGKIIIHAPKDSISGYPWGADNKPEIEWKG